MSSISTSVLTAFLVAVTVSTVANTCTTVYLHRALSHRALTLRPSIALVFRAVLWLSTGIKPKEWVAVHRKHHAYTDIEGDPHSPVLLGWKTVQTKNVALYRASVLDPSTIDRYAKDLPGDRWDTLFFGHNKTGLLSGVAILMIVLGPWTGLLAAFLHANIYLAGNAAVNALGHHFGSRPYDNRATNLQWLAFLTMGEGLHNNHHADGTNAKFSQRWYEFDLGWMYISILRFFRLATVR
jgi:stearoyl-CoA desaturase (delta-9 desaturase)